MLHQPSRPAGAAARQAIAYAKAAAPKPAGRRRATESHSPRASKAHAAACSAELRQVRFLRGEPLVCACPCRRTGNHFAGTCATLPSSSGQDSGPSHRRRGFKSRRQPQYSTHSSAEQSAGLRSRRPQVRILLGGPCAIFTGRSSDRPEPRTRSAVVAGSNPAALTIFHSCPRSSTDQSGGVRSLRVRVQIAPWTPICFGELAEWQGIAVLTRRDRKVAQVRSLHSPP